MERGGVSEEVEVVRRFNRVVTQRVGALDEEYLARGRPLGASRLLWEIGLDGAAGTEVRALRHRLDLDSGYLSRLLRRLESEQLVTVVAPDPGDGRRREVRLTEAGRAERALLDERSDALASSVLDALDEPRRGTLVAAMSTVVRLLTAGLVDVVVEDPSTPDAVMCLRSYFAELDGRFDTGFDPARTLPVDPEDMVPPHGLLLLARLHGEAVGCGALKLKGEGLAEIKRIWVSPSTRGLGVGRRLVRELEKHAVERGATTVRLDTNRTLTEAIALYRSEGYREVPRFNDEAYADHWFEKSLEI
jgi:ribosomal protein S18 acetylase RimI-like enzyme